jgi:predicted membrane GTPase involved in stress response
MTLEDAIGYVSADELIEITPTQIRYMMSAQWLHDTNVTERIARACCWHANSV